MPVKYEDSWRRPFYFPHRLTATAGVGNHLDRLHLQLHFWIFDQAASLTLFSTWFSTLYIVPFDSLLPVFTLFTLDWWQNENLSKSWSSQTAPENSRIYVEKSILYRKFLMYLHFACVCCQPKCISFERCLVWPGFSISKRQSWHLRAGLSGLRNMKRCRCGWALLKQEGGKKIGRRSLI